MRLFSHAGYIFTHGVGRDANEAPNSERWQFAALNHAANGAD
jgi:hypothetical protein